MSSLLISKKRSPSDDESPTTHMPALRNGVTFSGFDEVSEKDIMRYISKAPGKYCPLVDPLPTELIKANIDILCPILTKIVNKSITSGTVPHAFKEAVVSRFIKKPNLKQI